MLLPFGGVWLGVKSCFSLWVRRKTKKTSIREFIKSIRLGLAWRLAWRLAKTNKNNEAKKKNKMSIREFITSIRLDLAWRLAWRLTTKKKQTTTTK